jgi:hypothetical protein
VIQVCTRRPCTHDIFCEEYCRQRFAQELEKLPWSRKDRRYFLTREEEYVGGLRAATQIWLKMSKREVSVDDALVLRAMVDWPGGLELHIGVRNACWAAALLRACEVH